MHARQSLLVGFALFAMFFGGGNLIFPLSVGMVSGDSTLLSFVGFIISGVLLPFLGVMVVLLHNGDIEKIFSSIGKRSGFIFQLLLILFWIPFGSAPRCITLALAACEQTYGSISNLLFVAVYSLICYAVAVKRSRIITILGSVMTPVMLLSIGAILVTTLMDGIVLEQIQATDWVFFRALDSGLKTQDFIAAFFFSSMITQLVRGRAAEESTNRFVLHSCLYGVGLLSLVYLTMIYCGHLNTDVLAGYRGDQLLFALMNRPGSPIGSIFASTVIQFGCLSTSIALMAVFANFLQSIGCGKINFNHGLIVGVLGSASLALIGFESVSAIISPAMQILYPALLVVACIAAFRCCR